MREPTVSSPDPQRRFPGVQLQQSSAVSLRMVRPRAHPRTISRSKKKGIVPDSDQGWG